MERIAIYDSEMQQQMAMFRGLEYQQIVRFLIDAGLEEECCKNQLRALWTAYCLHHELDADTNEYDDDLMSLWERMYEIGFCAIPWENYDAFDLFMGRQLC